ncbi:hypothetical protein KQX54_019546 [Cotesia glomerata]|uniref:Uncharacterized protein n=1 Tax=Cotesia glomerata TaxID=32391 RepID=A0AAV7IJ53_COTGL|nr:hypothetical protein KQX54_019546 [Cotesia glomerata]
MKARRHSIPTGDSTLSSSDGWQESEHKNPIKEMLVGLSSDSLITREEAISGIYFISAPDENLAKDVIHRALKTTRV